MRAERKPRAASEWFNLAMHIRCKQPLERISMQTSDYRTSRLFETRFAMRRTYLTLFLCLLPVVQASGWSPPAGVGVEERRADTRSTTPTAQPARPRS